LTDGQTVTDNILTINFCNPGRYEC